MADAGVGEAALLAAAAESASAAAAAGGTAAAVLPEVIGAGTALAGTAAGTAAAAAPEVIAAAAPEIALATAAPTAAETAATIAPVAAEAATVPTAAEATTSLLPTAATTTTEAPGTVFLGATQSEPVTGGLLGSGTTTGTEAFGPQTLSESIASQDIGFGAGNVAPGYAGETLPTGASLPATPAPGSVTPSQGLLGNLGDKLGHWWETASTGEKLKTAGTALSLGQGAAKAMTPTPTKGPSRTMAPGHVGQPRGGEQALAAVVEGLLKRRDAYLNAQAGTPIAYRPRSLLG